MERWEWLGGSPHEEPSVWLGSGVPWPSRTDVPGNLIPRSGVRNLLEGRAPRGNLLAAQRLVARLGAPPSTRALGYRAALDTPIQVAGGTRAFTLGELFAALRAEGVDPHGGGVLADLRTAQNLLAVLPARLTRASEAPVHPSLCMDEGWFTRSYLVTGAAAPVPNTSLDRYGNYAQQAADLRALGAGRVRRLNQSDLYYAALFPHDEALGKFFQYGAQVPKPGDLRARLVADDFLRLAPATALVCAALTQGVKLTFTPFNAGGGADQNLSAAAKAGDTIAMNTTTVNPTKAELLLGGPPWQTGFLIPSGDGWDPWYFDHTGGPAPTAEGMYELFATNVWPTEPGASASSTRTRHQLECARRKALAVAALADGVGEWLAAVDRALRAVGVGGLAEVVDCIELCNETDAFFELPEWAGKPKKTNPDRVLDGAREAGALWALIAGPLARRVPTMRFRTELNTWHGVEPSAGKLGKLRPPPSAGTAIVDSFEAQLEWLYLAISEGMVGEVERWARLLDHLPGAITAPGPDHPPPDPAAEPGLLEGEAESAARWWATVADAGFAWPPTAPRSRLLPSAANLLHQVGFHFFHDVDRDGYGAKSVQQYTDTVRLGQDFRRLDDVVIRPLAAVGFQLSPTLGALSFPAYDPTTVDPTANHGSAFYLRTSEELQAAMHLRIAATALACGAELAGVFTFIRGPQECTGAWPNWTPNAWIDFSSAGVRNDLFTPTAAIPPYIPATSYSQGASAWPRSSWHTLGRLAWLLTQAGPGRGVLRGLRVAYNQRGCTVLCFEFPSPSIAGPGGAPLARAWARAYLAWVDQYASDAALHPDPLDWPSNPTQLVFQDPTRHKYELLPVVPRAAGPGSATGADPNGWATNPGGPDWRWTGWDSCVQASVASAGHFALTLVPCDPFLGTALAPACILTDATLLGVT